MKLEVKKEVIVNDGLHKGVITNVVYRETTQGYQYTDIIISLDDNDGVNLRVGYPTTVSKSSALGKLLETFGVDLEEGGEVDPDELINKPCQFITMTEEVNGAKYAKVIKDTLRPK